MTTLPFSKESEMATLGSMLLKEEAAATLTGMLTESDFYFPAHREIFKAMNHLVSQFKAVDLVTLRAELIRRKVLENIGGENYMIQIAESVPSAANAAYYAETIVDLSTKRAIINAATEMTAKVQEKESSATESIEFAEAKVFEAGNRRLGKDFFSSRDLARLFVEKLDNLADGNDPALGTPTGFYDLDKVTTGMYPGELTILAARPSMGKTALAMKIALNVAKKNPGNVAVFSLEMSAESLIARVISVLSEVPQTDLKRRGALDDRKYQRLNDAAEVMYGLNLMIDETSDVSGPEILGKCRRLVNKGGLSLIVVDYLQLMRSARKSDNRVQEISEIARSLKKIAKDLNVPVIALAQLNRQVEQRENKRPQLSDLRDSGSIEAEADLVMFVYRDNYYKLREKPDEADSNPDRTEVAEVIIAKHRNGPIGTVELAFEPKTTNFESLAS